MAQHLYEIGFKSKRAVYEWLWEKSFMPLKQYRNFSWVDFSTDGWLGIEKISGKHWKELDDDYLVPAAGPDPVAFQIIIGGGDEEVCHQLSGRMIGANTFINIDAWR
jgi:hypothetical protein